MSDADLRELERKWRAMGSAEDEAAYLGVQRAAGLLSEERLLWLARCGSKVAREMLGGDYERPARGLLRRWQLMRSGRGQDFGWFVELDGDLVASLLNPRFEDMFLTRYDLVLLSSDEETLNLLKDLGTWMGPRVVIRNRRFSDLTPADYMVSPPSLERPWTIVIRRLLA